VIMSQKQTLGELIYSIFFILYHYWSFKVQVRSRLGQLNNQEESTLFFSKHWAHSLAYFKEIIELILPNPSGFK